MRQAIFVTGAAKGIGNATARRFARGGWFVGAYDLDGVAVATLAEELGSESACAGTLDVVDAAVFARALEEFAARAGQLDVLFNCAGIGFNGDFETLALERHHATIDVNLKGTLNGCYAALPFLKASRGRVINMSSGSAIYGTANLASYSATKFAVRGLSEALSQEWARYGIRVMDLMPLFVDTPMVAGMSENANVAHLGIHLKADDIAAVVWKAAHYRGLPRVHWYPGLQSKALSLSQKLLPGIVHRAASKIVSGY